MGAKGKEGQGFRSWRARAQWGGGREVCEWHWEFRRMQALLLGPVESVDCGGGGLHVTVCRGSRDLEKEAQGVGGKFLLTGGGSGVSPLRLLFPVVSATLLSVTLTSPHPNTTGASYMPSPPSPSLCPPTSFILTTAPTLSVIGTKPWLGRALAVGCLS